MGLERLRINLHLDFPSNLLFSDCMLQQYSRLFRLTALVHYALHSVKRTWELVARPSVGSTISQYAWVMVLRHNMHHFTVALQRYLVVDVVASEFAKLEAAARRAESLHTLLQAHATFLDVCTRKAFLGVEGDVMLTTLSAMLGEVIELQHAAQDLMTNLSS